VLPLYVTLILLSRDVFMTGVLAWLKRHGWGPLPVHFMGKAATYNLLYAFPLLLLGAGHNTGGTIARPLAWAFAVWGIALYWWAAVLYVRQGRDLVRSASRGGNPGERPADPRGAEGAMA
jgi:cardiolipin synthase